MMVEFGVTFLPGSWFSCRALSKWGQRAQLAQSKKSLKSGLLIKDVFLGGSLVARSVRQWVGRTSFFAAVLASVPPPNCTRPLVFFQEFIHYCIALVQSGACLFSFLFTARYSLSKAMLYLAFFFLHNYLCHYLFFPRLNIVGSQSLIKNK